MENKLRKELNLVDAEKAYNNLKIICITTIFVVVGLCSFVIYSLKKDNHLLENRVVYITSDGLVGQGVFKSKTDQDVLEIQIRASIKYAVPMLYSFNSSSFDENMEKGVLLFGNSGKMIMAEYVNSNVRSRVFSSNLNVLVDLDDKNIRLTALNNGNYKAEVLFVQTFDNNGVSSTRELNAVGEIIKTSVSTINPFGFIIENWVVINESRN